MLVTALAFMAGGLRNELALTLLGTVFLTVLVYCFLGVFFMGLVHRRKGVSLSMNVSPENVNVGRIGEVFIKTSDGDQPEKKHFWSLPAILVRCELNLKTRDSRVIRHYANPGFENYSSFPVTERGAYYGEFDRFVILDAPGFFRLSFPMPQSTSPRLFALPVPAEETIPVSLKSGGTEQRSEPHYRKSDELTDHRPYVPGDDPRRINWKLYSHAPLGELFVREGEPEPPPHSRLLILIDTEADRSLFSLDEARRAVDLLCENALAAALEFSSHGMDILIGYTGGKISGEKNDGSPLNAAELATALALPAAILWPASPAVRRGVKSPAVLSGAKSPDALPGEPSPACLPAAPGDRAVLVLALPRTMTGSSALDSFIRNRAASSVGGASPKTDIVFIYSAENTGAAGREVEAKRAAEMEEAAISCVNLYNRRSGVHAERAAVSSIQVFAPESGRSGA